MKNEHRALVWGLWLWASLVGSGCTRMSSDNNGQLQSYPFAAIEAVWIRNGEPIEFDGQKWYPVNGGGQCVLPSPVPVPMSAL